MDEKNFILTTLRKEKAQLYAKHKLKMLGLFGSYARGDYRSDSDVDILVEFSEPVGMEIVDLVLELEKKLGKRVDLVSKKAVNKNLLPFVEEDLIYV